MIIKIQSLPGFDQASDNYDIIALVKTIHVAIFNFKKHTYIYNSVNNIHYKNNSTTYNEKIKDVDSHSFAMDRSVKEINNKTLRGGRKIGGTQGGNSNSGSGVDADNVSTIKTNNLPYRQSGVSAAASWDTTEVTVQNNPPLRVIPPQQTRWWWASRLS